MKRQCIYVPGSYSIIDLVENGLTQCFKKTFNEARRENPKALLCNLDWAIQQIRIAEDLKFISAPVEIDSKRYYEMLGVLPPQQFKLTENIESFILAEGILSDIYSMFFYNNWTEKYYAAQDRIGNYDKVIQSVIDL